MMTESEQIQRLQALSAIQAADVSSLLIILSQLEKIVRRDHPDMPDLQQQFLETRKLLLQQQLESMEKNNPALAARLQQLIDQSCTIFPYDYE